MIVVADGGGVIALLFVLVFLAMFVLLPVLFVRRALRAAGGTLTTPNAEWDGGGWHASRQRPAIDRSDVESLRDRLAHDVQTLDPGDDPVARQASADAAERYATCARLLDHARSAEQLRIAWLAAVEGLHAARVVRERRGLDLGAPIPSPPAVAPVLAEASNVEVEGARHSGSPSYEPGRSHWFPGGYYGGRVVPAGWYEAAFWPTALTATALGALTAWTIGGWAAPAYADDVGADGSGTDPGERGFGGWGDGGSWGDSGGEWDGGGWDGGGDWGGG